MTCVLLSAFHRENRGVGVGEVAGGGRGAWEPFVRRLEYMFTFSINLSPCLPYCTSLIEL